MRTEGNLFVKVSLGRCKPQEKRKSWTVRAEPQQDRVRQTELKERVREKLDPCAEVREEE